MCTDVNRTAGFKVCVCVVCVVCVCVHVGGGGGEGKRERVEGGGGRRCALWSALDELLSVLITGALESVWSLQVVCDWFGLS